MQSLSHLVAGGFYYGIAINYDLLKHLAVKAEYRTHSLETTDNDKYTTNQREIENLSFGLEKNL